MGSKLIMAVAVLICGNVSANIAWGQLYGPKNPEQNIPKEDIEASGTLKGIRNGVLYVLTEDGGQWVVNIDRNAQRVAYVGSAYPSWLRPGMYVELVATVNSKGETTALVSSATVMTPTKENPPGVQGELGGGSELFEVKDDKEKPKEEAVKVRVVGQITGIKENMATVNGGNAVLKIAFDPDAKLSVDIPGAAALQLVRPGDKVTFRGWYIQNNKGQAWANQVSISGSEAFSNKKPMPVKPMPPVAE